MPANNKNWVSGISSIRFVLALVVFLSHLPDPFIAFFKAQHNIFGTIAGVTMSHLSCGPTAVIAFFIISGFVIHYPLKDSKSIAVIPFLTRRWLRVGIPMLAISLVAARYGMFWSIPLWSLYCELFYYTIYPFMRAIKITWINKLYCAYGLSGIVIGLFIADNIWFSHHIHFRGVYWYAGLAIINLPCWLLGVLLALRIDKITDKVSTGKIWTYRFLMVALGALCIELKWRAHINFDYSVVVLALAFYKWLQQEILYYRDHRPWGFTEYLGNFSYTLYLCHMLLIAAISHFFAMTIYTWVVYILLTLILSYLVYLVLEYPAHRLAQRVSRAMAGK